jgi:hypothetical protein
MKISDYTQRNPKGDIGIEIEVEGDDLPPGAGLWRRERDGSLRGPDTGEYVLIEPVPIDDVPMALAQLKELFELYNSKHFKSPRAGIHAHVNVNDLTFKQAMTMICAYIVLEELFIGFCDKTRDGNLFCLPSYNAEYLVTALRNSCVTNDVAPINTDNLRYASINVRSIFKYGAIEFRSLESTDDFNKIDLWCQMLYKLKEAALRYRDPQDLLMSFSMNDYVATFKQIMGEHHVHLVKPNMVKAIRGGILRAQDIAFSRDWSAKNLNIFKKSESIYA